MLHSFFVYAFLIFTSLGSAYASPFYEWHQQNAKEYAQSLQNAASKTNKGTGKDAILARIKDAKAQKKWAVAIAELETLVGQNSKDINLWLDLALTSYRGAIENQQGYYEAANRAEKAAAYVYFTSQDKSQRALALLVYAAISRNAETEEKCLVELATLTDIKSLRQSFPNFADLMPFVFKEHSVDRDSNTPQVCFTFSHPLAEGFKPADFFEISPKIDGAFHIRNTKVCLSGIQFGENYKVIIKEGIPSRFGEKTTQSSKVNFLVDDKSSRLNFPTKTYILQKSDKLLIPLTAVNVKKIDVKVVRVNDHAFVEGFARPHRNLQDEVSSYSWADITNRYGELLYTGTMDIGGAPNKNITKQISLDAIVKDLLPGAYGVFVKDAASKEDYSSLSASQWVLVTDIGLTAFKGTSGLDVNARSLSTALPSSQVLVKLVSYNNQILSSEKTNGEGFAHFDTALLQGKGGNRPAFIYAYGIEGNFAALKLSDPAFDLSDRGVEGRKVPGRLDAFLYTERGVYRPGESVRVSTLLRNANAMEIGGTPLTFRLMRPDEVVVQTETLTGNAHGYYELSLPLSTSSRTGQWTVQVFVDPKAEPIGQVQFSVEDFVPTRLLVTLKSLEPYFVPGKMLPIDVEGRYLFGSAAGGLGGDASLIIRRHPNPFPQFKDYQFGLLDDRYVSSRFDVDFPTLDANGKAKLNVTATPQIEATVPLQAVIQAAVRDAGGRPQLGTIRLDVQTYPYMIGIKGKFKNGAIDFQDKVANIDVITVSPNGARVSASNLHYTLFAEETFYNWSFEQGRNWEYKPVREDKQILAGDLSTTSEEGTKIALPIEGWGYYRLEVKDPKTGAVSSFRFTKGYLSSNSQSMTPDKLTVIQDKPNYAIGETIRLHIDSPFDGEAILVVANQSLLETRNIKVSKAGTDVTLKASETWGTGAYVLVSAFRPLKNKEKDQLQNALTPKRAVGLSWMSLSPEPRTLKVSMTPPAEVKPRQKLDLPITVSGNIGTTTYLTVAAVDEGILMLTDFKTPKPQDYFLGKRMLGVEMRDLYGKILDAIPGEMGELRSGGDEGALARNLAALSKRSFRIVSLFQGPVSVDAKGNAIVPLNIPDFNGTLRLMVVAFNQTSMGSGDAQLLVRDPIVSEPVFPRFLNVGDTSQISLSLFNPSVGKKSVTLAINGNGAIELKEQTQTVTLEKDGAWHTQIPLKAKNIGDGSVTFTVSGEGFETITRTFEITVRPSTTVTSIKTTLLLKSGETKTLDLSEKENLLPNTASLTLTASDNVPWDVMAIVKKLTTYPYNCVEQTVSRGFALLYKKSMGILIDEETMKDVDKDLFKVFAILAEKQGMDGVFPLWNVYESSSDVWLTAYAFDFMQQAKALGVKVPEYTFEKAGAYLRNFVKSQTSNSSPQKLAEAAYALSLLAGGEIIEDGAIRYFFDTYYDKLTYPLSRAQLGQALVKIGDLGRSKQAFENVLGVTESNPTLLPYGTLIRNKAAFIKTLIETLKMTPILKNLGNIAESEIKILAQLVEPSNQLVTQEQAWLLRASQALTSQSSGDSIEKVILSLNDKVVENVKLVTQVLPENVFSKGLTLSNKGAKPLWVNSVLFGFPKEAPKAFEKNLKIKRSCYMVSGQEVTPNNKAVLTQGDQLIVVLKGELPQNTSPEAINYMLAVDWLPAGFEIESGRFGATSDERDQGAKPSQKYPWSELTPTLTTEARDDRFIAAFKLTEGSRAFTLAYRIRAVTPGIYRYAGLQVENMFIPTIAANTDAGSVEIKAKG